MDIKKMTEIKNISKIGKEKILLLALAGIMLVGASYFENIKDKKVPDSNVKTKTTSNTTHKTIITSTNNFQTYLRRGMSDE